MGLSKRGFSEDLLSELLDSFPPKEYFRPKSNPIKSYDFGFNYLNRPDMHNKEIDNLASFPALLSLYQIIRSDEFAQKVTDLFGDGIPRTCYSIVSTRAKSGSTLVPHKDSIAGHSDTNLKDSFVNIIFFVHASGPKNSQMGATGIYSDNEFQNPIFVPDTLRNSALVYSSSADFYHGFQKMSRGTIRLSVNAQFARRGTIYNDH